MTHNEEKLRLSFSIVFALPVSLVDNLNERQIEVLIEYGKMAYSFDVALKLMEYHLAKLKNAPDFMKNDVDISLYHMLRPTPVCNSELLAALAKQSTQ